MKEIYILLRDRVMAALPDVQEVDLYAGQYLNEATTITPAIYFEFLPTSWSNLGKNTQAGLVTVRVHIVQTSFASTRATTGYEQEFTALDYLDFVQNLHLALQGFEINGQPLNRNLSEPDINQESTLVEKVNYTFEYHDETTDPEINWVQVSPLLTINHPIEEA